MGPQPVVTNAMPAGEFLVGDFGPGAAQIIERETATVAVSFEHADFFVRNLAALRVEERIDLGIFQPFAFVKGAVPLLPRTAASRNAPLGTHAAHIAAK